MNAERAGSYRVEVSGHLDDHWAEWLGGQTLSRNDDASTTLTIAAVDQARLHGVLGRIRDLGVDLLAVRPEPDHRSPSTRPSGGRCTPSASLFARPRCTTPTPPGPTGDSTPSTSG